VIAAYILIQTGPGKATTVAAVLRACRASRRSASLAGPYDVIERAQALDGVRRTMTCPVVHL
jgi:hypothetical protein